MKTDHWAHIIKNTHKTFWKECCNCRPNTRGSLLVTVIHNLYTAYTIIWPGISSHNQQIFYIACADINAKDWRSSTDSKVYNSYIQNSIDEHIFNEFKNQCTCLELFNTFIYKTI